MCHACAFQYIGPRNWREKLKPHGSVCPQFWILAVEGLAPGRVYLMTSPFFSDSIVFSVHTRKQRSQKASFSNLLHSGERFRITPVFGDRFRRCSVDDSRIRSKTAPFSFENGLVWTGPNWCVILYFRDAFHHQVVKLSRSHVTATIRRIVFLTVN